MKARSHTTFNQRARQICRLNLIALGLSFCLLPCLAMGQKKKSPPAAKSNARESAGQRAKAHRDGQVWAALIFATSEANKTSNNETIQKTITQLGKAFPDKSFQLLGEHTQQIFSEYESWVVPSKDLFLKIDSKGPTEKNDGVNLHLQLWREKNVLLKTDVILRKEPIFITGPKWGKGQLIMVVELR